MTLFARPFRVTTADWPQTRDGVQFPSGMCILDATPHGLSLFAAISFEALELPADAIVEWADAAATPATEK